MRIHACIIDEHIKVHIHNEFVDRSYDIQLYLICEQIEFGNLVLKLLEGQYFIFMVYLVKKNALPIFLVSYM